jgi:hypothetical protein
LEGEAGLSAALAGFQAKKGFVVLTNYSEPRTDLSTSRRAQRDATNSGFEVQTQLAVRRSRGVHAHRRGKRSAREHG